MAELAIPAGGQLPMGNGLNLGPALYTDKDVRHVLREGAKLRIETTVRGLLIDQAIQTYAEVEETALRCAKELVDEARAVIQNDPATDQYHQWLVGYTYAILNTYAQGSQLMLQAAQGALGEVAYRALPPRKKAFWER